MSVCAPSGISAPVYIPRHTLSDPVFNTDFYYPYELALENLFLSLCALRTELDHPHGDIVRSMTFRLKSPSSIRGKLRSRRLRPGLRTARTLTDIAGIRLVLKDIRQIYRFADRVCRSGVAVPIERRDYIASPKPGGYRSLHLLLGVSVRYHGKLLRIPVEVQLRTPAMHDWAVHDHDTRYKPVLGSRS